MKNAGKFFGTQKQWFCVRPLVCVVLALVCAGTTFSQTQAAAKAKAITLDVMPLFKGILASNSDKDLLFVPVSLSYEGRVAPHMSIGGNLDMYFGKAGEEPGGDDIPYFYFGLAVAWRYYITEQIDKFFVGAMLGFNVQSIDGKSKEEDGGFAGPLIGVNFGYKAMLGKEFFIEPSMSYIYAKYNCGPSPLVWQGGLRIGLQF
jgi:hypothetical protein